MCCQKNVEINNKTIGQASVYFKTAQIDLFPYHPCHPTHIVAGASSCPGHNDRYMISLPTHTTQILLPDNNVMFDV